MKVLLVYVWFAHGAFAPEVEVQPWPSNLSYDQCKTLAETVTRGLRRTEIYCHLQQPLETAESIATHYLQLRRLRQAPRPQPASTDL
jgi:hypothetical protein